MFFCCTPFSDLFFLVFKRQVRNRNVFLLVGRWQKGVGISPGCSFGVSGSLLAPWCLSRPHNDPKMEAKTPKIMPKPPKWAQNASKIEPKLIHFLIRWISWNLHPALSESIDFDDPRAPFWEPLGTKSIKKYVQKSNLKTGSHKHTKNTKIYPEWGEYFARNASQNSPWEPLGVSWVPPGPQNLKNTPKMSQNGSKTFKIKPPTFKI